MGRNSYIALGHKCGDGCSRPCSMAISASAQYHVADTLWLGAQLQHVIPSDDAAIMRGSGALLLVSFRPDFD